MSPKLLTKLLLIAVACGTALLAAYFGLSGTSLILILLLELSIFLLFLDYISSFIAALVSILTHPYRSYESSRLLHSIEQLQHATSIDTINRIIESTLLQLYGFSNIEIFYHDIFRKHLAHHQRVPQAYLTLINTEVAPNTEEETRYKIIWKGDLLEGNLRAYLHDLDISFLLVFYSNDTCLAVFQAKGPSLKTDNKDLGRLLAQYANIALQRIAHVHAIISEEDAIHNRQIEIMQALAGSIAHEIRNPLNIISMILKVIQQDLNNPESGYSGKSLGLEEVNESIEDCFTTVKRANIIIDVILNNIRGNANTESFALLSLQRCCEKALDEYVYLEDEKGVITTKLEQDFSFKGDENLFIFVIFNILKNAFYYLSRYPNLSIEIESEVGLNCNYLYITDTGPGIEQEKLKQIFYPFYTTDKENGVGLGLAFCKRTMLAFGGDIHCGSVKDECTRFTLSFPKVPTSAIASDK